MNYNFNTPAINELINSKGHLQKILRQAILIIKNSSIICSAIMLVFVYCLKLKFGHEDPCSEMNHLNALKQ